MIDIAGMIEGSHVWDLCCGSGAFGIECLSAGASGCSFVDRDREAVGFVQASLRELGGISRAEFRIADVIELDLGALVRPGLVFLDPPYASSRVYTWAFSVDWPSLLADGGMVMVETPTGLPAPRGWTTRRYGETTLAWRWKA